MKYGPDPNHWNEYIFCAYSGHKDEVIFLTGIPDIRESLPMPRLIGSSATLTPAFGADAGGTDRLRGARDAAKIAPTGGSADPAD